MTDNSTNSEKTQYKLINVMFTSTQRAQRVSWQMLQENRNVKCMRLIV